jgi:hypothetical protein
MLLFFGRDNYKFLMHLHFTHVAYLPGMGLGPSATYCAAKAGVMGFIKLIVKNR